MLDFLYPSMEFGRPKKENVDFSMLPIMQNSEIFRAQETHAISTMTLNFFFQADVSESISHC